MKINELFCIKDKVVIITGASRGIGKDLAKLFACNDAKVALVARNGKELENVRSELNKRGNVEIFPFDVTKFQKHSELIKKIYDEFGRIDVLINNAGTNITKPATEITEEDWDKVMDLNLKSAFFLSQAVHPYFVENEGGKIVHMSSQMAEVGYFERSAYSSSKGGIRQLTKALAIEWADDNILVNAIGPTFIDTPMTRSMFEDKDFEKDVFSRIPLGRLAETKDLYGAILYLSSDASNMVTGQSLYVDGGWTSW